MLEKNTGYNISSENWFSEIGLFAKRPTTLYHSVDTVQKAHGVLSGIDIDFLGTDNRFGQAFYLTEVPDTTLAELAHHGKTGVNTIHYHFDKSEARILDLTKPRIARCWKYQGGDSHIVARGIAKQAKLEGCNVIRFNSERGVGANLAVLDDFNKILSHQMIVPAPTIPSGLSWEFPTLSTTYR